MTTNENPYTPPDPSPDTPPELSVDPPMVEPAGPLIRLLAVVPLGFILLTAVATALDVRSFDDALSVGFMSVFALEFAAIVFTGRLVPKSLNRLHKRAR